MLVSDISIYTYFYTLYSAENMQKPKFLRSKKIYQHLLKHIIMDINN